MENGKLSDALFFLKKAMEMLEEVENYLPATEEMIELKYEITKFLKENNNDCVRRY